MALDNDGGTAMMELMLISAIDAQVPLKGMPNRPF